MGGDDGKEKNGNKRRNNLTSAGADCPVIRTMKGITSASPGEWSRMHVAQGVGGYRAKGGPYAAVPMHVGMLAFFMICLVQGVTLSFRLRYLELPGS